MFYHKIMERKQALKDIQSLTKSLRDSLIKFGINYHNIILEGDFGKQEQWEPCMILRNSLLYRITCINFHLNLLFQLDKHTLKQLSSILFNKEKEIEIIKLGGDQQLFFFDDIVFHIISLFDYLGNLTGFLFYGEERMRLKWKGVVRCCKHSTWEKNNMGREKIKNSNTHSVILKHQNELLLRLEEYRASLFHYRRDDAKRKVTTTLSDPIEKTYKMESTFTVTMPKDFKKWIRQLAQKSKEKELTLIEAASWLVRQSFIAANEIITALLQDLKRIA